ncbi:MPT63 family protein [Mycolicibacterium sp. XJ1819]
MKIHKILGAAAIAFGLAAATVAPAAAIDNIQKFGTQEVLKNHDVVAGYTVTDLRPSSDTVPHPVAGRLYEATVTVDALAGWVTPMVPMFNARAENGDNYRVLSNVWIPGGLSGAAVPPGGSSTGKIYFDVVGAEPNSVVYNDGDHDLLGWVP